jgi:hypothetical protein
MATESEKGIDYAAILADLEAKRSVLDNAISSLRAVFASGALGQPIEGATLSLSAPSASGALHGGEIPAGAFFGKSIPEAVKVYLSLVKKKSTTRQIAEALLAGGMETSGKGSFENIVGSALYRVRDQGEILRVKGAWGLAEWWPAGLRTSQGKSEKRKNRKSKRVKAKGDSAKLSPAKTELTSKADVEVGSLWDRIVKKLKEQSSKEFTKQQLSESFGVPVKTIAPALARLVKKGSIRMPSPDTYGAAQT